jgi:vacuolar-type H+-ATPase subunit E/Vma4
LSVNVANLSALLDREVSAEIEAILSEAQESAAGLLAQARVEAEALSAQLGRVSDVKHGAGLVRAQSGARLEAASLKLQAQHKAVENVFEAARGRLDLLRSESESSRSVLFQLLEEAASAFPEGGVQDIYVNPADLELAKEIALAVGLPDNVKSDAVVGFGVRLRGQDNIVVENTLGQRLNALRDELASDVSRVLFSAEP